MASNRITYNIGFTTDTSGLSKAKKALQEIQNMTTADVKAFNFQDAEEELYQIQQSAKELETALSRAFNANLGTTNVTKLNKELQNLNLDKIYRDLSKVGTQGQNAFRNIATQALNTKVQIKESNALLKKLGNTFLSNISWSISSSFINAFVGSIQQAIGYVKNLDTSLNNIRIVTGASADEMERFAERANDAARNMGAATTDYTNAALIYYQQGLGDEEVKARTDVTVKTANVTQQSAEQVSEHLTAVWNGYKVSAEEAELYVDKLSAVAATTASDLGELSTGMSKVASAANTMGVDADQLNAQLATIISVTRQAPESVGTALKTIYARMGDLQVEGGTDEFGVSLGDVSGTLKEAGIEVLDVNGNLRDMGSVIEEVGSKWNTWTEAQKNAISIAIAGKRQYNNLFALFENWDMYTDTLNVSRNSMGALQEQQDIYMESTTFHLQQMKTAWEGVYDSALNTNFINKGSDALTNIAVLMENFLDGVGGGLPVVTMLASTLMNVFSDRLALNIQKFVSNLNAGKESMIEIAAQQEMMTRFGMTAADDALLQNLINTKRQFLQLDDLMTDQEKEKSNVLLDQLNNYQNQEAELKSLVDSSKAFAQQFNLVDANALNFQDSLTAVKEQIEAIRANAQGALSGGKEGELMEELPYQQLSQQISNIQTSAERYKQVLNLVGTETDSFIEKEQKLKETYEQTRSGMKLKIESLERERDALSQNKAENKEAIQALNEQIKTQKELYETLRAKAQADSIERKNSSSRVSDKEIKRWERLSEQVSKYTGDLKAAEEAQKKAYETLKGKDPNANEKTFTQNSQAIKDFQADLTNLQSTFTKTWNGLQEMSQSGLISKESLANLKQEFAELSNITSEQVLNNPELQNRVTNFANKITVMFRDAEAQSQQALEAIARNAEVELGRAQRSLQAARDAVKSFTDSLVNRGMYQSIVQTGAALGKMASGLMSMNNITNIISNEDLTSWEKFLQISSNLAFTFPSLFTASKKLFNLNKDAIIALKTKNKLEQAAKINVEQTTQAILTGTLTEEQANIAKAKGFVLTENNTLASTGDAAAKEAETIATQQAANAQEKLNLTMMKNPIILIITAIALAAAGIALYRSQLEKAEEQERELREERIEDNKSIIEENEASIELISSYEKVNEQYKEGKASKEEMADATQTLIDQYKDLDNVYIQELARVAELTGNYDELTEAIKKAKRTEIEESKRAAEQLSKDYEKQLLESSKEIKISTPTFSDLKTAAGTASNKILTDLFDVNIADLAKEAEENYYASGGFGPAMKATTASDYGELTVLGSQIEIDFENGNDILNFYNQIDEAILEYETKLSETQLEEEESYQNLKKIQTELRDSVENYKQSAEAVREYGIQLNNLEFSFQGVSDLESFYELEKQWIQKNADYLTGQTLEQKQGAFRQFARSVSPVAAQYADQASYIDELDNFIQENEPDPILRASSGFLERSKQIANDLGTAIFDKGLEDVVNKKLIFEDPTFYGKLKQAAEKGGTEYTKVLNEAIQRGLDPTGLYQYAEASIDAADQIIQGVKDKSISGEDLADNESWKLLSDQFSALGTIYSDLQNDIEILQATEYAGTEEWLFALEQVEEKWRAINENRLKTSMSEQWEILDDEDLEGYQIDIDAVLNDKEAYAALTKMMDADYQLTIQASVEVSNDISALVNDMKSAENLAGKIGENFVISAEDVKELVSIFPDIMNGATYLADGTIQLNEEVARSSFNTTQSIIQDEMDKREVEYNNAKEDLQTQINKYTTIAAMATQIADLEKKNDGEKTEESIKLREGLSNFLTTSFKDTADYQNQVEVAAVTEKANTYQIDFENYIEVEKAKTANKAEETRLRIKLAEAEANNDIREVARIQKEMENKTIRVPIIKSATTQEIDLDYEQEQADLLKEGQGNADELADYANLIVEALTKQMNDLNAQYEEGKAYLNQFVAVNRDLGKTTSDTAESTKDAADSTKDLADSTKDAADATSKLVDILNEEIDAYHDINIAITQLETSLSRLQEQQAKLTGNELISNLNAQLDILEKQKAAYAEKLKIAQMEANVNRILLTKEGATFNDDGTISNYSDLLLAKQAYVNNIIEKYNSMSAEEQEGYEATIEAAKKDYEDLKETIEKYDSLITEEIPGLQDSIQSAFNQQIEIQIEAFKLKVDLILETNEAEREWNAFVDNIINDLDEEDTLGNALTKSANLNTYYNSEREGSIQALTSQLNDTLFEIGQIKDLGFSSIFGDDMASAEEYAEELRTQLMSALEEEKTIINEIKDAYLEMIDEANEGLEKQTSQYQYISDLIEHDKNLISLLYGEEAYNKMSAYYALQNKNNKDQLASYKQQADFLKEKMDQEEANSEAWEKYKEYWQESVSNMNEMLETSIQGIIDEYTNTINIIFEQLENKLTGGLGLEKIQDQWSLINDEAEDYLDDINAAYEIQKFQNTLQEAIDNTDNLDAQQTLTNLMNEQLSILEKKDKITQYDLDRANALYEVEIKRIALQEAQQNKSKMRLRRDSQGNYTYQFVSDEDQVTQAAQDLADAQNSLYNLDKDAYKNNLDQIQDITAECFEKVQEVYADTTLTLEEQQAQAVEITQYYGNRLLNIAEQNAYIRENLEESVFQALADMYNTNVEEFQNMSEDEKEILMADIVPGWDDGIQMMIDKIVEQGGLMPSCEEAFEQLSNSTKDFNDSIKDLEDVAEISFDTLIDGLDECIDLNKDLLDSNEDLIDSWETQLSLIQDTIDSIALLTNVWGANKQAAIDAARAAWNYKKTQEIDVEGKGGSTGGGTSDNRGSSNGGNKGSNNGGGRGGNSSTNSNNGGSSSGLNTKKDDWGEDKYPAIGDKVTYLGDTYYSSSDGATPLGNRGAGENKEVKVTYLNPGAEYPVHVESTDAAYGWLKKYQIAKMDTGGYTGDWNSVEGKVAVLHEKELVLNKTDTSNILEAVKSIRAFAENNNSTTSQFNVNDIFNSLQESLIAKIANMMASLEMNTLSTDFEKALSQIGDQTLRQEVHIDAEFPGVQSASEIENAINNLVNVSSQYSFNTRR